MPDKAMAGYRAMTLNVYQLTSMAYDFVSNRPANLPAAEGVLALAKERYPKEGIVYARYGDLYQKLGDKTKAIAAYQTVLQLDPADQDSKDKLTTLLGH